MFWKRTTGHGAFFGLLSGTVAAAIHHGLTQPVGAASTIKGGWLGAVLYHYPSEMAQNFWTAIFAWTVCFLVTIFISVMTPRTKTDQQLTGLVYSLTPKLVDTERTWYKRPVVLGAVVLICALALNIIFR